MIVRCRCSGRLDAATPQQIMDDMEIDVFGEIITLTRSESEWLEEYKKALWQRYRFRYIANCDLEYWEQCVADKMAFEIPKFDAFMDKFADTIMTDLEAASGESITDTIAVPGTTGSKTTTKHTAISGTIGDKVTTKHTAISGTDGDETRTEHETFPITPTGSNRYLTDASTVNTKPNTQDEVVTVPNTQSEVTDAPNVRVKTEYHDNQDIAAATFRAMMDAYDSPLRRFVEEFDGFFLNRW